MTMNSDEMAERTCLVTGATDGIGLVTARSLAEMGATVVIVGRNPEKGAAVVESLKVGIGNHRIEFMLADLSLMEHIHELARRFKDNHERLDVLVNNVGIVSYKREETSEGLEKTLAVNHLGPFLLTNLLIDRLVSSAPSRIVNVSSGMHKAAKLDLDDIQNKRKYSGMKVYGQTKLMNVLFTYELAQRLDGQGVTVNAANPGLTATRFGTTGRGMMPAMKRMIDVFAKSPEDGARTQIYLASSHDVDGITGKYFDKTKEVPSSELSYSRDIQEELWSISEKMVGGIGGTVDAEQGHI
jgi:NAD(P)-dependent dehydrogenase (short-subunit alcohol dehydrogenase family)